MYEEAQKIFQYLPIRKNIVENDYIFYLWDAFERLYKDESEIHSYCLMPFHLLFSLAIQYKILRISREIKNNYQTALFFLNKEDKKILLEPDSVFDVAVFKERTMAELFKFISLEDQIVAEIKSLIDFRNENLGHAKSGMVSNPEDYIDRYIKVLENIQDKFIPLNDIIANEWDIELKSEEMQGSEILEFMESKLPESSICPADLSGGELYKKFGSIEFNN
jgi:hypothetical protein